MKHFCSHESSGLVMELYSVQKQKALDAIKENLSLEKYPLFTMNSHYLSSTREKWLLKYRQARKREQRYRLVSDSESPSRSGMLCKSVEYHVK